MRFLKLSFLTLVTGLLVFTIACQKEQTFPQAEQSVEAFQADILKETGGKITEVSIDHSPVADRCPTCPTVDPELGPIPSLFCNVTINVFLGTGATINIQFSNGQPPLTFTGPQAVTFNVNTSATYANVSYSYTGPSGCGGITVQTSGAGEGQYWNIAGCTKPAYKNQFFSFFICDNGLG